MTSPARERLYLAQHLVEWEGKGYAVHNPDGLPLEELPVIYGFNNGGSPGWYNAIAIAEDGHALGAHICSAEGYMPHDLGVLEGSSPNRHERFRKHYPGGYRMDFVGFEEAKARSHPGLEESLRRNEKLAEAAGLQEATSRPSERR